MKFKIQLLIPVLIFAFVVQVGCKGSKKTQNSAVIESPTPPPPPSGDILIGGYEKKDIYFKVQVGAFENPLSQNDPFFAGVAGIEVMMDYSPTGLARYSVGNFKKYEDADAYERIMKKKGYDEAFVVAYGNDDKRIEMHMQDVLRLYNMAK